jgi:hypothetical protein
MYKNLISGKWVNQQIPFIGFTGATGHFQVVPTVPISENRELEISQSSI